ncbi:GGDEF domain-containing protein, partial [Escherichia coli]
CTSLLERALNESQQGLALVILDIDHFKQFNDQYGHPLGDRVLQHVGQLLRDLLPPEAFAARYGGEEFAIWLPNADLDEASDIAGRVHDQIKAVEVANESVTVSIGIASLKPCEHYLENLLAAADKALYTAKAQGRNRSIRHE